ncbi:MAG: M28 family metallopeptidase [Candidatus Thorarchaeota archaeon]|jgi:hypothetical protein
MRRLWTVALFTLLLLIPLGYASPISVKDSSSVADTISPTPERIYGEVIADQIFEAITTSDLRNIVHKFTENGSRYLQGPFEAQVEGPNLYAHDYIIRQLNELTNERIEIEIIGIYNNIVGKLPGYLPGTHPALVVGAHYDSPSGCPGANTNGGGVAALLTLARVMSQYEWPLDIYFMAFNGLHPAMPGYFMEGSEEVSVELRYRGFETLALFNIDTVMYPHPAVPNDERVQMGYDIYSDYTESQFWAELTRVVSNNYGINAIVPVDSESFPFWGASDHYAFSQRGFSGVVSAFESGGGIDPFYHTGEDTSSNPSYSYSLLKEVTASIGGSMAYVMGRTYGEPRIFNYSIITRSGETERFYIPITTATNIEISCRWFGGPATFHLRDPSDTIIGNAVFDDASAWEYTDLFDVPVTLQGLYTLTMHNSATQSIGFELIYSYDSDIENNGVLDSQEFWLDSEYYITDADSDGLTAAEELFLGTDDNNIDSDLDTLPDKFEVDNGLDPIDPSDGSADEDDDGLTNAQEYSAGLNMFSADSDQDLMPDLWELENGLNPLLDDSMLDLDGDGRTNLQEYLEETDPRMAEQEPIPTVWFIGPVVAVAFIVGFLYYRRTRFEY